jgi:hypothetical protein
VKRSISLDSGNPHSAIRNPQLDGASPHDAGAKEEAQPGDRLAP